MPTKRIVCLANSFKHGGHCVAGIEVTNGQLGEWVRPVSNRPGRSLNYLERSYANGVECSLLDLIEIDFMANQPDGHQTENWVVRPGTRWRKVGVMGVDDLAAKIHNGQSALWPYTGSTKSGSQDKVDAANLADIGHSLVLIRPHQCAISVVANPFKDNKLDVRASFAWGGQHNNLKVTDEKAALHYQGLGAGIYHAQNPTLCISLGEVFDLQGVAYKLVAGVMT